MEQEAAYRKVDASRGLDRISGKSQNVQEDGI